VGAARGWTNFTLQANLRSLLPRAVGKISTGKFDRTLFGQRSNYGYKTRGDSRAMSSRFGRVAVYGELKTVDLEILCGPARA
jgi:hypothetical protein